MRYTSISTYDMTKGTFNELTELCEKGVLPIFAEKPGFVNFGLTDIGDHKVVSISIWETREQAHKSATMATTWVKANVAERVRPLTTQIGELALFRGMPVAV
jgi:heme-degrading monooxygenase HmoA